MFYYGGLWFTVNRLRETAWPGLLTLASFLVRTVLVAVAFTVLMQGSAPRLIVALLGFVTMRFVMVRCVGRENTVNWRSLLKGDFPS